MTGLEALDIDIPIKDIVVSMVLYLAGGAGTFLLGLIKREPRRLERFKRVGELLLLRAELEQFASNNAAFQESYKSMIDSFPDVYGWLNRLGARDRSARDYADLTFLVLPSGAFFTILTVIALQESDVETAMLVGLMLGISVLASWFTEKWFVRRIRGNFLGYVVSFVGGIILLVASFLLGVTLAVQLDL